MKLRFLGGVRQVTGSAHHLVLENRQILVDCGMEQSEGFGRFRGLVPDVDPARLDALFVTHAHVDHIGLIPKLVKDGFGGKIIATRATADLMRVMLFDVLSIMEQEAAQTKTWPLLYNRQDIGKTLSLVEPLPYGKTLSLGENVRIRLRDAGHILGSATIEAWATEGAGERKIVFSGDLGKKGTPIVNDPEELVAADYVVMESTYGDSLHPSLDKSVRDLLEVITETFAKGGNVVMPAFAVGRTEDILYTLNNLVLGGKLLPVEVYLDSPLAEEALKVYLSHPEVFDAEAKLDLRGDRKKGIRIRVAKTTAESKAINQIESGIIIVAGSGMCQGGRILHHLRQHLWRSESSVVLTGFQAKNTLGRSLLEGARKVDILGETVPVRSRIHAMRGFSAHADQPQLLGWLASFVDRPVVFLVHGEETAMLTLAEQIREKLGLTVHVPFRGEEYTLA